MVFKIFLKKKNWSMKLNTLIQLVLETCIQIFNIFDVKYWSWLKNISTSYTQQTWLLYKLISDK